MQRCTMDLELRELERASINLIPKIVMMESKTVLTQYIISKWSLEYKTESILPSCHIAMKLKTDPKVTRTRGLFSL